MIDGTVPPLLRYRELPATLSPVNLALVRLLAVGRRTLLTVQLIGKTSFLIYILLFRLHSGLATAWQLDLGYLLFHKKGVEWIPPGDKVVPKGCWALTNSSESISSVCAAFCLSPEAVVVQVTSPKLNRWKEFAKQQRARVYIMDIWSEHELTALL